MSEAVPASGATVTPRARLGTPRGQRAQPSSSALASATLGGAGGRRSDGLALGSLAPGLLGGRRHRCGVTERRACQEKATQDLLYRTEYLASIVSKTAEVAEPASEPYDFVSVLASSTVPELLAIASSTVQQNARALVPAPADLPLVMLAPGEHPSYRERVQTAVVPGHRCADVGLRSLQMSGLGGDWGDAVGRWGWQGGVRAKASPVSGMRIGVTSRSATPTSRPSTPATLEASRPGSRAEASTPSSRSATPSAAAASEHCLRSWEARLLDERRAEVVGLLSQAPQSSSVASQFAPGDTTLNAPPTIAEQMASLQAPWRWDCDRSRFVEQLSEAGLNDHEASMVELRFAHFFHSITLGATAIRDTNSRFRRVDGRGSNDTTRGFTVMEDDRLLKRLESQHHFGYRAIVTTSYPIQVSPMGHYFETRVQNFARSQGHPEIPMRVGSRVGGLVIGVTATRPPDMDTTVQSANAVPQSWCVATSGMFYATPGLSIPKGTRRMSQVRGAEYRRPSWHDHELPDEALSCAWPLEHGPLVRQKLSWSAALSEGDALGLLVTQYGGMVVTVNGERRLTIPDAGVRADVDLYPLLEVYGHVRSVRTVPHAMPPK